METLIIAATGLICLGVGYFLSRKAASLPAGSVNRREYDAAVAERITLATRLEAANDDKRALSDTLERTRRELTEARERAVTLKAEKAALEQQRKEQALQFEHTAAKLLENISSKFSSQSEEKIGNLLNPVRERLVEFQKLVGDSFTAQRTEQNSLKSEIGKIVMQADSLAKALRGDVKAQGNWGEVMLERILEASGLQKNIGYFIQGADTELTGAYGNRLRPDIVVKLPDKNHIIIDSKVSLVAYDRFCGETDELAKAVHLKEFLKSIRNHVSGLAGKNYPDIQELGTPDLVLMFMPIEGAFSLAVQQDQELHAYAWDKRIAIVCPSTLIIALKTIASLWRIERQNKNAEEIAKRGGALYDKLCGFIEHMQGVGDSLKNAQASYNAAFSRLHEGQGNLVWQTEKLKELGAKTAKSLPKKLLNDDEEEPDAVKLLDVAVN